MKPVESWNLPRAQSPGSLFTPFGRFKLYLCGAIREVWFGLIWFDIAFWEPATNQVGNSWQIWAFPLCTSIDLPFPEEWIVLECVWHVWSVWWFCSFPFLRSSLTCAWQSSRSVTYQGSITVYWAKIQSCDLEMGWKLASVSGSLLWRKIYDSNKINLSLNLLIWSRNKPGNLSLSLKHAQRLHRSCSTSIGLQTLAETNRNKVGYVSTNSLLEEQKSVSVDCSVTLPLCLCICLGFLVSQAVECGSLVGDEWEARIAKFSGRTSSYSFLCVSSTGSPMPIGWGWKPNVEAIWSNGAMCHAMPLETVWEFSNVSHVQMCLRVMFIVH